MMLTQTKRGEEIEGHRRDQIVIFRRADVSAVMRVARLESQAKIFPIVRRRLHVTSLVSEWRDRNPSAHLLVSRGIRARRATGRIDRCASVAVCGKEIREAYRHRAHRLLPGLGMISRPAHKGHLLLRTRN